MADLHGDEIPIDTEMVRALVARTLPEYAGLDVHRLGASGSTNALFRLGSDLLVRMPRQPGGSAIEREARWLPLIERELSVATPSVIAVGEPGFGYPEPWSVNRYLEGQLPTAAADRVPPEGPRHGLAEDLARLIRELRAIEAPDEALRDEELTWYRGRPLIEVDDSFRRSVAASRELDGLDLDLDAAVKVRDQVLEATRGAAVLDFGTLGVGDPSVDLVAAWEVLDPESRVTFRRAVDVDEATWRGDGLGAVHLVRDVPLLLGHDARPMRRPSGDGTRGAHDRVAISHRPLSRLASMQIRNLGASGLRVSAISYGNWITHGSQVEEDAANACVRQALDEGITTFDTADVYANTRAESVLGKALAGERREGLEIFTKVFWPTGPGAHNDHGLSRKHIMEAIDGSLSRLGTDYVDLYQAHRYDHDTPLEETMEAFADVVRAGKALYIGVSEWRAEEIRAAHALARELRVPLVSNQPQYNLLWRVIEAEVVPTCEELGIGQIVWSPIAQGALTGKYQPGQPVPEGSRATDTKGGADMIGRWLEDDVLERIQLLRPIADEAGLSMSQLAVAWTLQNPNVSSAIIGASRPEQVTENAKAAGVTLDADVLKAIDDAVGDVVERDPGKTKSPRRPGLE